ncbi:MAG: hypothetical protein H6573_18070 [Lewinellaceae bacterium]|nr:hypothetical protein [Phaeodactylibacter sp.]MCB9349398.1 hypothetical protein [Lewinellaceae bacterium]
MQNLTISLKSPLLLLCLALLGLTSCADETPATTADPFADCRYGAPKPIFNEQVRSIIQHNFRLEEDRAVETVSFDDGLQLSILQTGCDYINQEFRFNLTNPYPGAPASFWIQEAINHFYRLGQLGSAYVIYASVADALNQKSGRISLGQSTELQSGFYARIEDGKSGNGGLLVITLSEQPSGSVASN